VTYYLLIFSILIWSFGQLLNFQVTSLPFTFYPLDIICTLLTLSLLFSAKNRLAIIRDPLFRPLALFLLVAFISLFINFKSALAGGLSYPIFYLVRLIIYPSVYFATKISANKKILPYLLISLLVFASIGLLQYLFFPDMRYLKLLGFDDHYYRLIGSFYDPNFSGAIFAGAALTFLSLGQWFVALPLVLLLALTFSRVSYLIFIFGVIYLLYTKKKLLLLTYLVLLVGLIVLIPKPFGEGVNLLRTFSIFSRFESWQIGINLFFQRPLFGWGYNTLRLFSGERFQIDNSYLYFAATTGIVGLLAFFNLLKKIFSYVKPLALRLFILAILTHSLFNNSLLYIWIYFSFWLVLGLPLKVYKES